MCMCYSVASTSGYKALGYAYSGTPVKGQPWNEDTSLIRALDQVQTSYKYVLFTPWNEDTLINKASLQSNPLAFHWVDPSRKAVGNSKHCTVIWSQFWFTCTVHGTPLVWTPLGPEIASKILHWGVVLPKCEQVAWWHENESMQKRAYWPCTRTLRFDGQMEVCMCSKEEEELGEDFLDVSKAHNTMQREWLWKNTYIVFTLWELSRSWRKRT